jgi:OmpA-OmpF porin, OOP family
MKRTILLIACAVCLAMPAAYSQTAPSGLAARLTHTNFQFPLSQKWLGSEFKSGAEIEYIHSFGNVLSLGVPLRLGIADFPLDDQGGFRNTSMLSLDATLQLKYFRPRSFIYPYLYAGIGGVSQDFDDYYLSAPLGLGLNFRLANNTYLSTKAEYRLGFKDLRDDIMLGAGIMLKFGEAEAKPAPISDRDGDGVPDAIDRCPDVPGLAIHFGCPDTDGDGIPDHLDDCPTEPGPAATRGCPDRDNDGVADKDDECPDEAGPVATRGCPDRDGDGVADKDDDCPDQAGPAALRGCPDRDGDGVPDKDDECPDQAGPVALRGCPDRDGDGVADKYDKCPDTPGPASNQGCPVITQEDKAVLDLAVKNVQFETGKANLLSASFPVLDQVADLMRKYPDYKLRISGHTDSIGEAGPNQRLSENRAKTCYDYLVARGIAPSRMVHEGFGESKPIADNRYKEGRDKNRRVEFELYLD